jgi:hypothetical protein
LGAGVLGYGDSYCSAATGQIRTAGQIKTWHEAQIVYFEMKLREAKAGIKPDPKNQYVGTNLTADELQQQQDAENRKYEQAMKVLPGEQMKAVLSLAGLWLGLSIALYVLGWLIAWTIRGFRNSGKPTS